MKSTCLSLILIFLSSLVSAQQVDSISTGRYIPFAKIEKAPVYPGCEDYREGSRRQCLQNQITNYIANNYNASLANNLDLEPGKKRIYVQFVINKNGGIEQIKAKGPHIQLEKEAIRVISSLPKMTPAKQSGENVNVKYTLPITL